MVNKSILTSSLSRSSRLSPYSYFYLMEVCKLWIIYDWNYFCFHLLPQSQFFVLFMVQINRLTSLCPL